MPNAYTDILSGASLGVNLVQTGYEKLVAFKLRSEPLFRRVADTRATALTNPGTTVVFNLYNDLTADTNTMAETTIPDSVAIPSTSTVSVTLNEFGKTVIPTLKLRTFTLSDVDPAVANIVARDQAESVDLRVRAVLDGATNRIAANGTSGFDTGATNTIVATDLMNAGIGQFITARFRTNSALESMPGNTFGAFIHPDQAYDFMTATASGGGWRYPHENVAPENLWLQRVGVFGGVSYIETPRVKVATDGASSAKVYRAYFFAQQAIAEVVAVEPHLIIGPVTDPSMRFRPLSWYGIAGWNVYRQESLYRAETGSSIAAL